MVACQSFSKQANLSNQQRAKQILRKEKKKPPQALSPLFGASSVSGNTPAHKTENNFILSSPIPIAPKESKSF